MADLALDATGDLDLSTNDFTLVEGLEAIRQELQIRYRFFLGEWFLNENEGVPYQNDVLKKNPNEARVRAVMIEVARTTPGVREVTSLELSLDGESRTLSVTVTVGADAGEGLVYEEFIIDVEV